jgi:hypothetical protein
MNIKKEIKWQLRQAQGFFDGWEQGVAEALVLLGFGIVGVLAVLGLLGTVADWLG